MTVKALKSFSGERFEMYQGEIREVELTDTVEELLKIGYLAEISPENPKEDNPNEAKRGKPKHS